MSTQFKILLVDDSPTNLNVLSGFLGKFDYKLLFASNGERAIEVAQSAVPDMILLDVMMPGIDGYETCRRIKALEKLNEIPILFLSALDTVNDKVKGFESGGVDYISKPFQREELLARVKTHLELYRIRSENKRYANEMEALAEKRARSLIHADRLATLGTLSAGVAHEINNPTTFISVGAQTLNQLWKDIEPLLGNIQADTKLMEKVSLARSNIPSLIENIKIGVMRIQKIVNGLKTYSHSGNTTKSLCDIKECITAALDLCHNKLKTFKVQCCGEEKLSAVLVDEQQIEQVFVNLFINAADAMEKEGGKLVITTEEDKDNLLVYVDNDGSQIPDSVLDRIWLPFYTTKSPDKGTGLGLSISKGIIEEHGGIIEVRNRLEGGVRFIIKLPIYKKEVKE